MLIKSLGKILVTAILVVIAAIVLWNLWVYYEVEPRTRDGRVRANVVTVAPDVAGQVVELDIKDNQTVKKGQVLFKIDPARYTIAVAQAKAALAQAQATLEQARRDQARYDKLGNDSVSTSTRETAATATATDEAGVQQAAAALDLANLNLKRTEVLSPVNGIVTNLNLQLGDYVGAGTAVTALVDSDSYYVTGYFEETKLSKIHVGDRVRIKLMGDGTILKGHVTGISAAISDADNTTSANLLPDVAASFTWVRLAQRIPVRIALDDPPASVRLVAGRTASVDVLPQD